MEQNSNTSSKNILLTSKVLDLSYLTENLGTDKEMLSQLIEIFMSQSPEKVALLQEGIEKKDYQSIRETSHFLKSSFNIMGLQCTNDLKEIELLSTKKENLEKINLLTKNVIENFNESIIEYKKIISLL